MSNDTPLLDLAVIEQLKLDMGDMAEVIIVDLVESLERDAARQLAEMRQAVASVDSERFWRAAHGLKGSCASLGVSQAAMLCLELESVGKRGELVHVPPLVDRLQGLIAESAEALRNLMA